MLVRVQLPVQPAFYRLALIMRRKRSWSHRGSSPLKATNYFFSNKFGSLKTLLYICTVMRKNNSYNSCNWSFSNEQGCCMQKFKGDIDLV